MKKFLKISAIIAIPVIIIVLLYFFVFKDYIRLKKEAKNNPGLESLADGYFGQLFKTVDVDDIDISGEVTKGEIPLFMQWDKRWGYKKYGSGMLALTGCGPTCVSMVVCGLTGDLKWNPAAVADYAKKNGYYSIGSGTSWLLMQEGVEKLGLEFKEVIATEAAIKNRLNEGRPVICSMRAGDFTTSGHYIVLVGVNADGTIKVNDPNSRERSEKGWSTETLLPQIRGMWAYKAKGAGSAG